MQAGFKVLETGMVRKNHIHTVAMKNMVDWSVVSIVFLLAGFGLLFGHSLGGIIGSDVFSTIDFSSIEGENELGVIFFLFLLAFVGTALTIVIAGLSLLGARIGRFDENGNERRNKKQEAAFPKNFILI